MLWLDLTSPDLENEVKKGSIVVMPIGSIEIHGPHLPLGMDTYAIQKLSELASEKEYAIVLPALAFAYVPENRHFPGTMTMPPDLILATLNAIVDEVARNGFEKILLVNGHGGNTAILDTFVMSRSGKRRPLVYAYLSPWEIPKEVAERVSEGLATGHACVKETSQALALFKDLVKMQNVTHEAQTGSTDLPRGVLSSYWWQAYCEELYLGDPRRATEEKGKLLNQIQIENIAKAIKAVKEDRITPGIADDFLKRAFRA